MDAPLHYCSFELPISLLATAPLAIDRSRIVLLGSGVVLSFIQVLGDVGRLFSRARFCVACFYPFSTDVSDVRQNTRESYHDKSLWWEKRRNNPCLPLPPPSLRAFPSPHKPRIAYITIVVVTRHSQMQLALPQLLVTYHPIVKQYRISKEMQL